MRQSYTLTEPDNASGFPFGRQDSRRKNRTPPLSRSMLMNTFMGLLINQAKVPLASTHYTLHYTLTLHITLH